MESNRMTMNCCTTWLPYLLVWRLLRLLHLESKFGVGWSLKNPKWRLLWWARFYLLGRIRSAYRKGFFRSRWSKLVVVVALIASWWFPVMRIHSVISIAIVQPIKELSIEDWPKPEECWYPMLWYCKCFSADFKLHGIIGLGWCL